MTPIRSNIMNDGSCLTRVCLCSSFSAGPCDSKLINDVFSARATLVEGLLKTIKVWLRDGLDGNRATSG